MPDSGRFDKGFNLEDGSKLGKYTIETHFNNERSIIRYKEYSYDITIKFINNRRRVFTQEEIEDLKRLFSNSISSSRIIYTAYGNPYECSITINHSYEDGIYYVFECKGHAYRV